MAESAASIKLESARHPALPASALVRKAVFALAVIVVVVLFALPVAWMAGTSIMPPGEFLTQTPRLFPSTPTLEHYVEAWNIGVLPRIFNSVIVTLGATILALFAGAGAAYGLARYGFPARLDVIFLAFVLIVKLMPPIVVAEPLFQLLRLLGLLDSRTGLVLANQVHALPLAIWMLVSYFRDIPVAVEEAAALDGANAVQRLFTIVLPMAMPGIFATGILVTILAWNEYLFALLFIQSPSLFTLPIYISSMITEDAIHWGRLMAVGLASSLPVILGAAFLQKQLLIGFASAEK
jgi:multiple sugar transport system permease protein